MSATTSPPRPPRDRSLTNAVGGTIFLSRWLQAPLYLGLIVAQGVYVVHFWKELVHLVGDFGSFGETEIMLIVLGLVDVVMIANLLVMVIIGGYETFVSRIRMDGHPDQPEWLSHVNPNVLKVKLAMSIIGISSVHLLKTFIEAGEPNTHVTTDQMLWQTIIHMAFIVSAVALAFIDSMAARTNAINAQNHQMEVDAELVADGPPHASGAAVKPAAA
jgi:uncharacterized protein (TIGR00645 family)